MVERFPLLYMGGQLWRLCLLTRSTSHGVRDAIAGRIISCPGGSIHHLARKVGD